MQKRKYTRELKIEVCMDTGREFKDMGEVQSVIDTGKASDNKTSAYKYADRLQQKQDRGADLSDWNVGRQYQKNVKAIDAENALANTYEDFMNVPVNMHDKLYTPQGQEINGRYTTENNRYSPIEYDKNGTPYVRIDENILDGVPKEKWIKVVRNTLRNKFSDGIRYNGETVAVSGKSRGEFTRSTYTDNMTETERSSKFRMANNLDEVINTQNNMQSVLSRYPYNGNADIPISAEDAAMAGIPRKSDGTYPTMREIQDVYDNLRYDSFEDYDLRTLAAELAMKQQYL